MIKAQLEYPKQLIFDGLSGSLLLKSIDFARVIFGQRLALKIIKYCLRKNEKWVCGMFIDFMYEIDELSLKVTGRHEGDKAIFEFEKLQK